MFSDDIIEINLKRLFDSEKKSLMRIEFRDEKGRQIQSSKRFAEILNDKGLIKLEPNSGYRCDLTDFGSTIYENGGWKKYLETEKEKTKINAEKDKYEFLSKKWVYKTRLLPYLISGAALLISILTLIINLNKQTDILKIQKEIESLKLEIKKNGNIKTITRPKG